MAINISAYTGYFIKAKCIPEASTTLVNACPQHGEIQTVFCAKCGLQAVPKAKFVDSIRSISDIIYDSDNHWKYTVTEEDTEWIQQHVTFVDPLYANCDNDFDYFFIGDWFVAIDDVGDGCIRCIDLNQEIRKPNQQDIDRVVNIVGYQQYTVEFGTIVCVNV